MRPRNVIHIAFVVLAILNGYTISAGQPESSDQPGNKKAPFRSAEGRFSVLMPGAPKHDSQTFEKGDEKIVKHRFVFFRDNRSEVFMVLYMEFPESTLKEFGSDKLHDIFADGIVTDAKGRLREKRAMKLEGSSGWELKVDVPKTGIITARVFLLGNRCYHVIVGMPSAKASSHEARDFLDSFKILK